MLPAVVIGCPAVVIACPGRVARVRWGEKTPTSLIEGLQQAFVTSVVRRERKSSQPPIWKESQTGWIKAGTRDPQLEGAGAQLFG